MQSDRLIHYRAEDLVNDDKRPTYLGRNRYGNQGGLVLSDWARKPGGASTVLRLFPLTLRDGVSEACHLEIPVASIPDVVEALQAFHQEWMKARDSEKSRNAP